MKTKEKIMIVGAGLSGLTLAYLLSKENIDVTILEASDRIGGRIQTINGLLNTPMELGTTWFSDLHTNFISLLEDLKINKYPQFSEGISLFQTKSFEPPQKFFIPKSDAPSYRIEGGTKSVIDVLAGKISADKINLNEKITHVTEQDNQLLVNTSTGKTFNADKLILCLPPQLASKIDFSPALNDSISKILPTVQTWMAGSIKFVLEYKEPFWRNEGFSGMLYSHAGIVAEMYDHTNMEENKYGFTGFLNSGAASYNQEVRKDFVLNQLSELLGSKALIPVLYQDKIWNDEFIINGSPFINRPHQNNGHLLLQDIYMNGKLLFCGTETASEFGGYMEGAVIAAKRVFNQCFEK